MVNLLMKKEVTSKEQHNTIYTRKQPKKIDLTYIYIYSI